jgi:hypothetical protein
MATTTNFGWTTPDDTSLVKDGAAAIRSLGQAIDTSLMDLEGGTSGQTLIKNSNTDMDFIWATPAAGGMTQIATGSLAGSSLVLSSIPATYKHLQISLRGVSASSAANMSMTFNAISSGYTAVGTRGTSAGAAFGSFGTSSLTLQGAGVTNMGSSYTDNSYFIEIYDYASTNTKKGRITEFWNTSADAEWFADSGFVSNDSSAVISTVTITLSAGTFDAGTYILWGLS